MIQKAQIIQLVHEFKKRSRRKYKDVAAWMDSTPEVTMTEGVFQSKFRRSPERQTGYEAQEIPALIRAFTKDGKTVCTAFEGILLCSWTGVGFSPFAELRKIFGDEAFDVALKVSSEVQMDQITWANPLDRQNILEKLAEEKARYIQQNDPAAFLSNVRWRDEHPLLEVLRNPPENASFIEDELFEQYDHREIVKLIEQAANDVNAGQLEDAVPFLTKLTHKDNRRSEHRSDAYHYLGIAHIKRGNYAAAGEDLQRALDLASDSDLVSRARILANMGANAFAQGFYLEADSRYRQGLELAQQIEHHNITTFLISNLGFTAFEMQDYDRAYGFYQRAEEMALISEHPERLAYAYKGLGTASEHRGNLELSKEQYATGLDLAEKIGHTELMIQFNWLIGVLQTQTEPQWRLQGEGKLKTAAALAIDNRLPRLWAIAFIALGKYRIQECQWNVAIPTFQEALLIATQICNYELIAKAAYGIALAEMASKYIIGMNDTKKTLRTLSLFRIDSSFANIPQQAFHQSFLEKAHQYFKLGLPNYPNLERYRIVAALRVLFDAVD